MGLMCGDDMDINKYALIDDKINELKEILKHKSTIVESEQRASLAQRIRNDLAGTRNANVGYIQFTDNVGNSPKFEPIELNNSDQRFETVILAISKLEMYKRDQKLKDLGI